MGITRTHSLRGLLKGSCLRLHRRQRSYLDSFTTQADCAKKETGKEAQASDTCYQQRMIKYHVPLLSRFRMRDTVNTLLVER